MSAEIWGTIGIIGFSFGGLLFLVAVFIFFRLNILAVIGDLSGQTAAKQIEKFRQANAASGAKAFRPDPLNVERGELTSPVVAGVDGSEATTELGMASATTQLLNATTALSGHETATTLLSTGQGAETSILSMPNDEQPPDSAPPTDSTFRMMESMVVIHTDEVIEEN